MTFYRCLALGLLVLAGCREIPSNDDSDVIVPGSTKVLDSATLDALSSVSEDFSTFTFARSTPLLDALKPGDVLVSDVHEPLLPAGTLRRVQAVNHSGGSVIVTAGFAALDAAIEQGSLHAQFPLRLETPAAKATQTLSSVG